MWGVSGILAWLGGGGMVRRYGHRPVRSMARGRVGAPRLPVGVGMSPGRPL
jgi:hypothetical protein